MGTLTLVMIVLTAIAVVFGTLSGIKRGLNHSILRFILIIGCAVGAIYLHQPLTDIIMEFKIGETSLVSTFIGDVANEQELIMNLYMLEIIVKIGSYLIIFGLLRFLSWLFIFPILKIFVKKDLIKKKWWGALFGLIQGLVIAFVVLVPTNALFVSIDAFSKIDLQYNIAQVHFADIGLEEYVSSPICQVYSSAGEWYCGLLTEQK